MAYGITLQDKIDGRILYLRKGAFLDWTVRRSMARVFHDKVSATEQLAFLVEGNVTDLDNHDTQPGEIDLAALLLE